MANKLKNGSNCAACVRYPETDSDSWILTKVDKKLPGNRYLVRDEFADDPRYETYNVDSSHITPFPSTLNEEYKIGETVLALWRDEGTNEWSTMFYNAEVAGNKTGDPKTIQLLYSGTDFVVDVEKDKIARLPPNFTFTEVVDEKDEKQSTTATEEASEDNSPKGKKGKHQKEELSASNQVSTSANNEGEAAVSTEESSESKTDETANTQEKKQAEITPDAASEDTSTPQKADNANISTTAPSIGTESESLESKANEGTTNDEKTTSDSNEVNENITSNQNSIQPSIDNSIKSDDQTSLASEKNRRSKTTIKENSTPTSSSSTTSATPKLQTPEDRRVYFMFHKPEVAERPKLEYLSNEDFTKLAGPKQELKRMDTKEGTPLLDSLEDPELFNQENLLHVTGSGIISVANVEKGDEKSGLAEGRVPCGRLRRIINEWIKNPMDSI